MGRQMESGGACLQFACWCGGLPRVTNGLEINLRPMYNRLQKRYTRLAQGP